MPNGIEQSARPATPLEVAEWDKFKRYYETVLSKVVYRSKVTAEIANQAQEQIDKLNISGFIFDEKSLANSMSLLHRFNVIGRYIVGVESGKYGIQIKNGDIDILAPPGMSLEEYQDDIYPSLGIHPIIWVIVAVAGAAVLVGGLWGVTSIIEADAEKEREINKGRLIEASKEMAKQPPDVKNSWDKFLKSMTPVAKEAGVLEEIFGSETAGKIGSGIGVGLLLIAAAFAVSHWRRS